MCSSHSFFVNNLVYNFFLQATLTSYSENVERTKYGGESSKELGSGGNLKQWQSQKSSMDSCLYRVDENMSASTYSLNKIPERNLETVLSQSVQSIPLYLMPRPNSVAGKKFMFVPLGQSQTQHTDATALLVFPYPKRNLLPGVIILKSDKNWFFVWLTGSKWKIALCKTVSDAV